MSLKVYPLFGNSVFPKENGSQSWLEDYGSKEL